MADQFGPLSDNAVLLALSETTIVSLFKACYKIGNADAMQE